MLRLPRMAGNLRVVTDDDAEWLSTTAAARMIGVHRDTLKRYEDRDGLIRSARTPHGQRRYLRADVQALLVGLRRRW